MDQIPLGISPETIFEQREERWPRQYAQNIFMTYPEHERLEQVDRLVPVRFRAMVRHYLTDFAMREKILCPKP